MKQFQFYVLLICFLLPMISFAQNKQLTLEDLIPGGKTYDKYQPKELQQLAWYKDRLTYVEGDTMYICSPQSQKKGVLLTLQDINKALNLKEEEALKSLTYTRFSSVNSDELIVTNYNKTYIYDIAKGQVSAVFDMDKAMENRDFAADNRSVAYTKANNLYVQLADKGEQMITNESDQGIVSGQAVHRNEFGITKGTFWSPDDTRLAFYRMDETKVSDYPLVDMSSRVATLKDIKYPMAGMKSHQVTVGIYNIETQKTVFLKTGKPFDRYLTNIAWDPSGKYIYVAEVERGQKVCYLRAYNSETGDLRETLLVDSHPKYVEPQNPMLFLKNDPAKFIWQSRSIGYNHLELYTLGEEGSKTLTSGKWEVTSVLGFDQKGENVFIISTEVSPLERNIYKVNLKTNKRTKLSREGGIHRGLISASGRYICDVFSSQKCPYRVDIFDCETNKVITIHLAENPLEKFKIPLIELGTLTANDGETDLHYRLVKPADFDPQKKYPVVIYVYGGPHAQLVVDSWLGAARGWDLYMAQKGYIIFTLDNRGSQNRGLDFENIIHRQAGIVETQDQMIGVDYLKSLPYIDSERIGVHGWSYGGFMALNLMLRHPDVFKVGVAGGAVTDWKYYEIMYGERYMETPQNNPEGYKETSMINRAGDLKGRLLMIHGDEDPVVVMQHNMQFIRAAINAGTHPDMFIYPGQEHNMRGHDRVHLHEHITRYFDDFLK